MTRARSGALVVLAVLLIAAGAFFSSRAGRDQPREKPRLLLLTSLPLMFGEGFSLEGGSPALDALQSRYRVVPISVTSPAELAKGRLLLMAQPLAQAPENLVALDAWVRRGGHLLLLADPMLEWPSSRPLGDRLRPPATFADTGLLAHWGLRLDAPEERGPRPAKLAEHEILAVSPGTLSGGCAIGAGGLVARCRLGKGVAVVVADADLLNVAALGAGGSGNLKALLAELDAID